MIRSATGFMVRGILTLIFILMDTDGVTIGMVITTDTGTDIMQARMVTTAITITRTIITATITTVTTNYYKSIGQKYETEMALEKKGVPTMPAQGSGEINTGNKVISTPADKGKESSVGSPSKENNTTNIKQGNTGNAVIENYTTAPANKGGKEVETNPSKGNVGDQNSAGKNPADQYTTKPTQSNVQQSGNGGATRSNENNNSQQRGTSTQVPNSNGRTQEHQQRRPEYSYPQREAEQPAQRQQENRQNQNGAPDNNRKRDGYSRYSPSQGYSYPERGTEQRQQNNNSQEKQQNNSQERQQNNSQEKQQNNSQEKYEHRDNTPAPSQRQETPRMERREAPQSAPQQQSAPRNDSRSNSGGGGRRR